MIVATIISQTSASGPPPRHEESDPAQVLTLAQAAGQQRQIPLHACLAPRTQENLVLMMSKTGERARLRLTRQRARLRLTQLLLMRLQMQMQKVKARRKREVLTRTLVHDALGVPPVQVHRAQQTGAVLMLDECYAHYAAARRRPFAESYAKHICDGGTHRPQPCVERLNSLAYARKS